MYLKMQHVCPDALCVLQILNEHLNNFGEESTAIIFTSNYFPGGGGGGGGRGLPNGCCMLLHATSTRKLALHPSLLFLCNWL